MGSLSSVAQEKGTKLGLLLLVFGGCLAAASAQHETVDSESSQSGFVGAGANAAHVGNHGKYFQYGHQDKDHYDMGHRRGNEHHFIERHEKGSPHHGHVSTKVRWGDKHGGYGEHYWDYNHAGHHDGGEGDGTAPIAEYTAPIEEIPQKKKSSFRDNGSTVAVAASTNTRRRQQARQETPTSSDVSPSQPRVNPVKLPKVAAVTSESQINEQKVESRLPSSWSPIPSLSPSPPSWSRPLTAHQLSRVRRSHLRMPVRPRSTQRRTA